MLICHNCDARVRQLAAVSRVHSAVLTGSIERLVGRQPDDVSRNVDKDMDL